MLCSCCACRFTISLKVTHEKTPSCTFITSGLIAHWRSEIGSRVIVKSRGFFFKKFTLRLSWPGRVLGPAYLNVHYYHIHKGKIKFLKVEWDKTHDFTIAVQQWSMIKRRVTFMKFPMHKMTQLSISTPIVNFSFNQRGFFFKKESMGSCHKRQKA